MKSQVLVCKAKLAEQAGRFEDMLAIMKQVAYELPPELSKEERKLFWRASKKVMDSLVASWRVVKSTEERGDHPEVMMEAIDDYTTSLELELVGKCNGLIYVIVESLFPNTDDSEAKVFYYRMKGDCYRYLCDIQVGNELEESSRAALEAYQSADTLATSDLSYTHPLKIELAVSMSGFYYDILKEPDKAVKIAKDAFNDHLVEMGGPWLEEDCKDGELNMMILRDRLALWLPRNEKDDQT